MYLLLQLLELDHSHLYPKFSLGCLEAFREKCEMVFNTSRVLQPSSDGLVTECFVKRLARSREWKAPFKARF